MSVVQYHQRINLIQLKCRRRNSPKEHRQKPKSLASIPVTILASSRTLPAFLPSLLIPPTLLTTVLAHPPPEFYSPFLFYYLYQTCWSTTLDSENENYKQLYEAERRLRLQREKEIEVLKIKLHRIQQRRNNHFKISLCPNCCEPEPEKQQTKTPQLSSFFSNPSAFKPSQIQFHQQLKQFSVNMDSKFSKLKNQSKMASVVQENESGDINFIQNLCVFGIPDALICAKSSEQEDSQLQGQIVLSVRKPSQMEQTAARVVFPQGMVMRRYSGEKLFRRVEEIMAKSYSSQNTFIINLMGHQDKLDNISPEAARLLDIINPQRKLFCVCVGTRDFTYIGKHSDGNQAFSMTNLSNLPHNNQTAVASTGELGIINDLRPKEQIHELGVSQRVYCITSFFPLFSFFESILLSILNIVKVERIVLYKHRFSDIKQMDSRFQLQRLRELYQDSIRRFNLQKVLFDKKYSLKFLDQTLTIDTSRAKILTLPVKDWAYQVLSLFTAEAYVDLFTLFLLQEKLVIVCQNSHILTYLIYMLAYMLCRPFSYPHPVFTVLNDIDVIGSPFPFVYGLLKKPEYIKELYSRFMDTAYVTYIAVTPANISFSAMQPREDLLRRRPQRLRKAVAPFFDRIKEIRRTGRKFLKSDPEITQYSYEYSEECKQLSLSIIQATENFMQTEIVRWIPDRQRVQTIKAEALKQPIPDNKDINTYLNHKVTECIIANKKNSKEDKFFLNLLQTQMLSNHLSKLLG